MVTDTHLKCESLKPASYRVITTWLIDGADALPTPQRSVIEVTRRETNRRKGAVDGSLPHYQITSYLCTAFGELARSAETLELPGMTRSISFHVHHTAIHA